jgi:putative flippase GtrA
MTDQTRPPTGANRFPNRSPNRWGISALKAPGVLATFVRHQIGALVASLVDFGTMIGCVAALGLSPVSGAAVGSTLGAATNFGLGRTWIFKRGSSGPAIQAVRYAIVAALSAAYNSFGEHLVHDRARVPYVLARLLVAAAVGIAWNFPMHRHFVFR